MDKGKVCINAKRKVNGEWVSIDIDEIDWDNVNAIHVKGKHHFIRNQWIPITERIPNTDVDVLVTEDTGGMPEVWVDSCFKDDDTGEIRWYVSMNVTAWMPLPEPWRGEENAAD